MVKRIENTVFLNKVYLSGEGVDEGVLKKTGEFVEARLGVTQVMGDDRSVLESMDSIGIILKGDKLLTPDKIMQAFNVEQGKVILTANDKVLESLKPEDFNTTIYQHSAAGAVALAVAQALSKQGENITLDNQRQIARIELDRTADLIEEAIKGTSLSVQVIRGKDMEDL